MALVLLAIASQGPSFGCDTHAVGVADCQEIEKARCAAAHSCSLGINATNEAECERFARDNCLHGLPTASSPLASQLNNCLKAIRAAGACADAGPNTLATKCTGIENEITVADATACDIVESPEETTACSFLVAEPKPAVTVDSGAPSVDAGKD